jgi:hypothetical protein
VNELQDKLAHEEVCSDDDVHYHRQPIFAVAVDVAVTAEHSNEQYLGGGEEDSQVQGVWMCPAAMP